jgi:hypothetical protein
MGEDGALGLVLFFFWRRMSTREQISLRRGVDFLLSSGTAAIAKLDESVLQFMGVTQFLEFCHEWHELNEWLWIEFEKFVKFVAGFGP